jgi:hypothetical protein
MDEVLSNAQLRHDILFDPDLQFKTSTEDADSSSPTDQDWGPGDEKTRAYWQEMHIEVTQGLLYRIPLLVSEIRAILIELLPNGQDIKDDIGAHLDAHLIHQQIEHGIMDPMPIFQYIADLMKTNCAPIRDVYVDDMLSECKKGNIVKALKLCFDVFELMKLVLLINIGLCKPPVISSASLYH